MRKALLALALALPLGACFDTTQALTNPGPGERFTCRSEMAGFNPWSQNEACTAGRVAAGWVPQGYGR